MSVVAFRGAKIPRLDAVHAVLDLGLSEGVSPGLAALVLQGGKPVHWSIHGDSQLEPEKRALARSDIFDVASLTKVIATTTLAAIFVQEGKIDTDDRVVKYLPAFGRGGKSAVTIRQLLAHTSGLPAWREHYLEVAKDPSGRAAFLPPAERPPPEELKHAFQRGLAMVKEAVLAQPLEAEPGKRALYSDLGFMALGWVLEAVGGEGLDALCEQRIFRHLKMKDTFFLSGQDPKAAARRRKDRSFVATERCEHRQEVNCGAVNDDNAWAMGGVAGHAGLFSTAPDVGALGQSWLDALRGRPALVRAGVARLFAIRDGAPVESGTPTRALGWDTPSPEGSAFGTRLGRSEQGAIGHLGWTGTSLWIDPAAELVCVLLTNRCHPSRDNERIKAFRPRFHDAVAAALAP
jgi:CubicO group peptidase (beta-lactamase class C family)